MKYPVAREELLRREQAIKDEHRETLDRAAITYMSTFLAKRGASMESVIALTQWSDFEKKLITDAYRNYRKPF
jgi:hypothetical protein